MAIDWRKICCAIDFSAGSDRALELAADLARRTGAMLLLVHVEERTPRTSSAQILFTAASAAEQLSVELREDLARWARRARELSSGEVQTALLVGDPPAEQLAAFAEKEKCDLLVLGTHGRRGLGRAFFGSVAEKTARLAHCPVLLARPGP